MKRKIENKLLIAMSVLLAILTVVIGILALNVIALKKNADFTSTGKTTTGDSKVEIYLPEVYYAASGLTMEIYNSQITNLGTHIGEYDVVWDCEVGEMLERKFSITATEELIGEYPLTVTVYDAFGNAMAD